MQFNTIPAVHEGREDYNVKSCLKTARLLAIAATSIITLPDTTSDECSCGDGAALATAKYEGHPYRSDN